MVAFAVLGKEPAIEPVAQVGVIEPTTVLVTRLAADTSVAAADDRAWSLATCLAFRFGCAYFTAYVCFTQMLPGLVVLPLNGLPVLGFIGPPRQIVEWTARHVFGVTRTLVVTGSGSGDKTFDWVQAFVFLVVATAATIVWSVAATGRTSHPSVFKWFRLFLRFAVGSTLVGYGMAKVVPLQMPAPSLARLVEPYGQFSPMGALWASIGASRPYEIFTGCVEMAAAILLFIPRTATLGAIVSLMATIEVFVLNMTYDVPVKLFSFQLILMSLFLLAPQATTLLNVLVLDRPADRVAAPRVGSARSARVGLILQLLVGVYIVGVGIYSATRSWTRFGGGAPRSALYGIWNVAYLSIDGVERAPLITDYDRWRRLLFDFHTRMAFQRMDDTLANYGAKIDVDKATLTLSKPNDSKWTATFAITRPAADRMELAGEMDGRKLHLKLELMPRESFLLINRGFNWIQEYPFNR